MLTFEPLDFIGINALIVLKNQNELRIVLEQERKKGRSIGFVPTMGALHDGHLQLLARSKKENDCSLVSIYVNPTQFNNTEDLDKYPRTVERDLDLLEAQGCDYVFTPAFEDMYPQNRPVTKIDLMGLDQVLEGEHRPGHFDGVVAVVDRFFELIEPDSAYFGEKDFQQLLIVELLAKLRHPKIKIVPCPIVREASGLAMSSRNARLSENEKQLALYLVNSLNLVKENRFNFNVLALEKMATDYLESHEAVDVEYFKIVDQSNLSAYDKDDFSLARAFVAAQIGPVRLIDNMKL